MVTRTTVAVDETLRKRLKKLAAMLDKTQGEIITEAISAYEQAIVEQLARFPPRDDDTGARVAAALDAATREVWASDPETRAVQERLLSTPGTIDDFILDTWDSGLES